MQRNSAQASAQNAVDQVISEYSGLGCARELPQAKYDWCMTKKSEYEARIATMKANWDAKAKHMTNTFCRRDPRSFD